MELDIYFKEEYGKIYELNNEGKLVTFQIENENGNVKYMFLKKEIPIELDNKYFDIVTPYGYGGPLFFNYENSRKLENLKETFKIKFSEYCEANNIVSEFSRFHPILENQEHVKNYMEIIYNRDTICIEIESEEKIMENLTSNCRNMIRKAVKNGVEIKLLENTVENLDMFYEIYTITMNKNNANDYYYFSKEFFKNTLNLLKDNVKIFSAFYQGKMISSSLIIYSGEYMHYHFSGTNPEYRNLAANNLLLYECIVWGSRNGKKYFHLGGGYLGNDDALYKFKSSFSKKEPCKFYIGKKIHNLKKYEELVEKVKEKKQNLNLEFFPLYRG